MLSPSDFNNAVPQFTNGDYASNPINPQYIAEPDAVNYNRGAEPLQTLPAQWWNWFLNKITGRFNKVNIYVKNIFNELTQLLSLVSETPSGTEGSPTVGQLKDMFETKYPDYLKTTTALSNTYVPQTTKVNGHALSGNITITCVACAGANGSGTAFGTSATVNTGTAVGCIPTVGTALGTTDGQFLATDSTGKLKPSGYTASSFRSSSWTPSLVACACYGKNGNSYSAFGSNAFNSTAFTTCTGTVTQVKVGTTAYNPSSGVISLPAYPSAPTCVACAGANGSGTAFGDSATKGVFGRTNVGDIGWGTTANQSKVVLVCAIAYWDGAYTGTSSNLKYYCGGAFGSAAGKTAGPAAGNVPMVATGGLEGTTYGRLVAATQGGSLFATNYTTASFLGATAEACCAVRAKCVDNKQTGASTIGDIYFCTNCTNAQGLETITTHVMCGANGYYYGDICGNVCGTATSAITASVATSAGSATYATLACCARCIYPEVANALCTPNSSSICNKCSFAVLAFNSCNGCVMYLPSKKCMNASNSSCFGTTALRII